METRMYLVVVAGICLFNTLKSQCEQLVCPPVFPCLAMDDLDLHFVTCANGEDLSLIGTTQNASPDDYGVFLCGTIENNLWHGFIAANSTIMFELTPNACISSSAGLQFALYEYDMATCAIGPILACESPGILTSIYKVVDGLCVGGTYLIMIDGFNGAQCDYTLTTYGNDNVLPPSLALSPIEGEQTVCPGTVATFSTANVASSTGTGGCGSGLSVDYDWSVGAGTILSGQGTAAIEVLFPAGFGAATVEVVATTLCEGPVSEITYALDNNDTGQHRLDTIVEYCLNDSLFFSGTNYEAVPGIPITLTVPLDNGCDSVITILPVPLLVSSDTTLFACEGDTLLFYGEPVAFGQNYVWLPNPQSDTLCDSLVNVQVAQLNNFGLYLPPMMLISCGDSLVQLEVNASSDTGAFSYLWYVIDSSGQQQLGDTTERIRVALPGTYGVEVTDLTTGCSLSKETQVTAWFDQVPPQISGAESGCVGDTLYFTLNEVPSSLESLTWNLSGTAGELLLDSTDNTTVGIHLTSDVSVLLTATLGLTNCSENIMLEQSIEGQSDECTALITGIVAVDENDNCLFDLPDDPRGGARVELQPNGMIGFTDVTGRYQFEVAPGAYTLRFVPNFTLQSSCSSDQFRPVTATHLDTLNEHFLIALDTTIDLRISGSIGLTRPGQSTRVALRYENRSNRPVAATITYQHDPIQTNLTVDDTFDTYDATSQTATLALSLAPGQVGSLAVFVRTPDGTPFGTPTQHRATITPLTTDIHPADNLWLGQREVTAAYDPNIKTNMVGTHPLGGDVYRADSVFDYRIDFQNTGTDTARQVVVRDTLDEDFVAASIIPGWASHPVQLRLEEGGILIAEFPGIVLPDSSASQAESRGYFTYRIRVSDETNIGTEFRNSASIYFDANPPVRTNTVVNTVEKEPETTATLPANGPVATVFPNPTTAGAWLRWSAAPGEVQYVLYDVNGRQRWEHEGTAAQIELPLAGLSAGVYVLLMRRGGRVAYRRVVRQ